MAIYMIFWEVFYIYEMPVPVFYPPFLLMCRHSLYTIDMSLLSVTYIANIFSQSDLPFHLLMVSLDKDKFFNDFQFISIPSLV